MIIEEKAETVLARNQLGNSFVKVIQKEKMIQKSDTLAAILLSLLTNVVFFRLHKIDCSYFFLRCANFPNVGPSCQMAAIFNLSQ